MKRRLAALALAATLSASALIAEPAATVNVNTATAQQLSYLPSVGAVIAERIIAARPIADLAALDAVKGIGPKVLEQITPYVCFEVTCETTASTDITVPKNEEDAT